MRSKNLRKPIKNFYKCGNGSENKKYEETDKKKRKPIVNIGKLLQNIQ